MGNFFALATVNLLLCVQVSVSNKRHLVTGRGETMKPLVVDEFLLRMWNYHNKIRYLHGAVPLELDKRLSQTAQDWAECLVSDRGSGASSTNTTALVEFTKYANDAYGENIFIAKFGTDGMPPVDPARLAMFNPSNASDDKGWYTQKDEFFENANTLNAFSMMAFNTTLYVGCGQAFGYQQTDKEYVLAVVCHYIPPGNVFSEGSRNVLQFVHPEVPGRKLEDYKFRRLTKKEMTRVNKPKHPLIRYQLQILDFLETMRYKPKKVWYDAFLFRR